MKTQLPPPPFLEPLEPPKGDPTTLWLGIAVALFIVVSILGAALFFSRSVAQPTKVPVTRTVQVTPQSCLTALAEADKDFHITSQAVGILETTGNIQQADALFATIDINAYLNAKAACRGQG